MTTDETVIAGLPQDLATLAMNTGDSVLLIWFDAVVTIGAANLNPADIAFFRLFVDASMEEQRGVQVEPEIIAGLGGPVNVSMFARVPVTAGAHTVRIEWDANSDAVSVLAASAPSIYGAELLVMEVTA